MNDPTHLRTVPVRFHRLRFLSVIGGFLDGQTLEFTTGLNCLIGARGTGKTTVLELVRYALDMLPSHDSDPAERRRVESLLKRNLAGGRVQLGIETRDGLAYVVNRSWGEEPMVLTTDGHPTEVTLRNGCIFKADIYSQNEVEQIADRPTMQLHLIDNFDPKSIADVELDLLRLKAILTTNAGRVLPLQKQLAVLVEELSTLPNVDARLGGLSADGETDTAELNRAHALKGLRDREQRIVNRTHETLGAMADDLATITGRIARKAGSLLDQEIAQGLNGQCLQCLVEELLACGRDVDHLLNSARRRVVEAEQPIKERESQLAAIHKEQELAFRLLIEKQWQMQDKAEEQIELERLRNELLSKRMARDEARKELAALQQYRNTLLEQFSELRDKRFAIRKAVADRISQRLAPAVRVTISHYGNTELYHRLLDDHLRSSHVKHGVVAHKLANAFWPTELSAILRSKDVHLLVDKAELSQDQAEKAVVALADADVLLGLETVEVLDRPRIELQDGEEYKDSSTLSTGQKCTAVLPILLLDSENPLLVDQPEDNLDNRFIFEKVVGRIDQMKQRRQLIFVTHNPNIPVLADAQKVFVLESDGSAARIAKQGSVAECRTEIITLLEGGEDAFNRRKERYSC